MSNLSCLVFGAGAIGTYIGGSLALHGERVVFLERPEVTTTVIQHGLHLNMFGQEQILSKPNVVGSIEAAMDMHPFDLAIIALKSFDTQNIVKIIQPYADELPPFLCLQNGVENEAVLGEVLGADKVIAGVVTSAVGRRAVGDIILERARGVGVSLEHPIAARVLAALHNAGLNVRGYQNGSDMKWSKMLTNLLANATTAILNLSPAQIFDHPGLFRVEIAQLRETLDTMHKLGLKVTDLPGTPVRALGFCATLPDLISRPILRKGVGSGRGGKMPSFHIDLYNNRGESEVDYLNGAVVRFGSKVGIPTPVNRFLNETLLALTRGQLPLDLYAGKPDVFISALQSQSLDG
jgi:2-dehydropantoate 2-reductase